MDIDGLSVLSQSFVTQIGSRYSLSFDYSRNFNAAATSRSVQLLVQGNASLISETIVSTQTVSATNMNWQNYFNSFIADSTTTTLSFSGLQSGTTFERALGFALDEVSVTQAGTPAVPLPASLPLMLAGLDAFAIRRKRKVS